MNYFYFLGTIVFFTSFLTYSQADSTTQQFLVETKLPIPQPFSKSSIPYTILSFSSNRKLNNYKISNNKTLIVSGNILLHIRPWLTPKTEKIQVVQFNQKEEIPTYVESSNQRALILKHVGKTRVFLIAYTCSLYKLVTMGDAKITMTETCWTGYDCPFSIKHVISKDNSSLALINLPNTSSVNWQIEGNGRISLNNKEV